MKKVLVVAYYFPPLGMGGVQSILNFCRYLPNFGWTPVVLTVKPIRYFAYAPEFLQEVSCKVYRSESLDPLRLMKIFRVSEDFGSVRAKYQSLSNFLFIPDNKIGWLPFGVNMGIQIIKQESIDVIFTTAPPYTGVVIGYLLKKISNLPLVVNFRDPWPYFPYATLVHQWICEWLKIRVISSADAIIAINEPIRASLLSIHYPLSDIQIIPSGYNPDYFRDIDRGRRSNKFTIVYIGSFIPPRTPIYFLKALSDLIADGKIKKDEIRVEIIGFSGTSSWNIKELGLGGVVIVEGYRPHRYCLERLGSADLLWLMMDEVETGASTGKIGEYLGAGKPILATVPDSPCADIVRETNSGIVVPPRDVTAIRDAIYDFYLKHSRNELLFTPIKENIEKYSCVNLTNKLADILDNLVR